MESGLPSKRNFLAPEAVAMLKREEKMKWSNERYHGATVLESSSLAIGRVVCVTDVFRRIPKTKGIVIFNISQSQGFFFGKRNRKTGTRNDFKPQWARRVTLRCFVSVKKNGRNQQMFL